jgi:hypothetical protein
MPPAQLALDAVTVGERRDQSVGRVRGQVFCWGKDVKGYR